MQLTAKNLLRTNKPQATHQPMSFAVEYISCQRLLFGRAWQILTVASPAPS